MSEQPAGHHWKQPERVRWYAERMDRRAEERRRQFDLMARLIPFGTEEPIRLLDVGAGYGVVAAAVLDAFPNARAVLLDVSEEMIRLGRERMAPYAERYEYVHGDFAGGSVPDEVGSEYHAVMSSLAIHHLPPEAKRSLYRDIAGRLRSGGCFLNLDSIAAPNAELEAVYRRVADRERPAQPEAPPPPTVAPHHSEVQPLSDHLSWLAEAGLVNVDCFWKRLDSALFGGFKPA